MDKTIFFGGNLRYLRKLTSLKQDEMQASTGVGRTTWANYESGTTEPNFDTLVIISKFFGVSIDDLITKNLEREAQDVALNPKSDKIDGGQNVALNVAPNVAPSAQNEGGEVVLKLKITDQKGREIDTKQVLITISDVQLVAQGYKITAG